MSSRRSASISTEPRACPLCDSRDARPLYRQRFEPFAGRGLMDGYDVVCCAGCGCGYAAGIPDESEFAGYYSEQSKYEDSATSGLTSQEDQQRCEAIVDIVSEAGIRRDVPVLDVGCSTGALLAAFKRRGFADVEGMDPSSACAESAMKTHGVSVRLGTAEDLPGLAQSYGLVLLSEVLEHLVAPRLALQLVRDVLSDDGVAFVEVPDVQEFADCATVAYQEFSVEHVNFFSASSLHMMARISGLDCVFTRRVRVPWPGGTEVPVVRSVFARGEPVQSSMRDDVTEPSLRSYLSRSAELERAIRERIARVAASGEPVLVWGTGTHTRHLLAMGALDCLSIVAYVDSDPNYQGGELRGVRVVAPKDVAGVEAPIVVCSGTRHHEIEQQIRNDLGADRDVLLLYR